MGGVWGEVALSDICGLQGAERVIRQLMGILRGAENSNVRGPRSLSAPPPPCPPPALTGNPTNQLQPLPLCPPPPAAPSPVEKFSAIMRQLPLPPPPTPLVLVVLLLSTAFRIISYIKKKEKLSAAACRLCSATELLMQICRRSGAFLREPG